MLMMTWLRNHPPIAPPRGWLGIMAIILGCALGLLAVILFALWGEKDQDHE